MEEFIIDFKKNNLITNHVLDKIMLKVLRVIKSINNREQFGATRRYIDLWYAKYGTENKKLIELYFKSKKSEM